MEKFLVENNFFRHVEIEKRYLSDDLLKVVRDPAYFLDLKETKILQDNFKSKIGIVDVGGLRIVIKRHNFKSNWHKFKRLFRRTRASRSWHYAHLLLSNDIMVPAPVGFVESKIGPFRLDSYFFYQYVDGISGEEFIDKYCYDHEKIESAITYIEGLLSKLKALRLIHGDIRIANMIFDDEKIWLVDFDDMRFSRWFKPMRVRKRDIRGLLKDIYYNVPEHLKSKFIERLKKF